MAKQDAEKQVAVLIEHHQYRLGELCQRLDVTAEWVMTMVGEAIVEPTGAPVSWCFSHSDLERLRKARNLERELQINLPGIALALDLLAELDALRRIVRLLPPLADAVDDPLIERTE